MLDKQKIVTAMRDIYDMEAPSHMELLVFTRRQFLHLFDDIVRSRNYDFSEESK